MVVKKLVADNPLKQLVAAVSVGLCNGSALLDLDYGEDSTAETDLNVVMTETGSLIEVQGTAEQGEFSRSQLTEMLDLAENGIAGLIECQQRELAE